MLPSDAPLTVLPWRILVPLLQLYGCFPYRISSTNSPPVFSLPLCLCSVAMQLLMVILFSKWSGVNHISFFSLDMGTICYIFSTIVVLVSLWLAGFILLINSVAVAALLHDLSQMKNVFSPSWRHWLCNARTLLMLAYGIILTCFSLTFTLFAVRPSTVLETLFLTMAAVVCSVIFWLPIELFYSVLAVQAHHLLVNTKATATKVSAFLAGNESFKCESDVKTTMAALVHLDAVIQEVEVKRAKTTRLFFPIINIFFVIAIMLAITSPYTIIQGSIAGGGTFGSLLLASHIMGSLFHAGQMFTSQVSEAEGVLKQLRAKSQDLSVSLKVNLVMGSLSSLLTFDVCGWYTLSYSSLLAIFNTIMTYIVIIFQEGGGTIKNS
ncbi:uncharacterized protein LOC123507534 [Portunus trituberculatus]|uniref:uncharacterized protein LOC123507534 n=1 Tax=Portunus trituberculatus TaxID=210409 RepID=UPI001E1D1AD0|nr:uncharacterized protein LOC123507534 [Portunus trituberculatus]